jgi:hypothetical protein
MWVMMGGGRVGDLRAAFSSSSSALPPPSRAHSAKAFTVLHHNNQLPRAERHLPVETNSRAHPNPCRPARAAQPMRTASPCAYCTRKLIAPNTTSHAMSTAPHSAGSFTPSATISCHSSFTCPAYANGAARDVPEAARRCVGRACHVWGVVRVAVNTLDGSCEEEGRQEKSGTLAGGAGGTRARR